MRELFGLFLLFWALLLLLSILSFDANDPSLNHVVSAKAGIHNKAGLFGAYTSGFLNDVFGVVALLWPLVFAAIGAAYISASYCLRWWRWAGLFLLTVCLLVLGAAWDISLGDLAGGGMVGSALYENSARYLSPVGSFLLWFFVLLIGLQLTFNFSWMAQGQRFLAWLKSRVLPAGVSSGPLQARVAGLRACFSAAPMSAAAGKLMAKMRAMAGNMRKRYARQPVEASSGAPESGPAEPGLADAAVSTTAAAQPENFAEEAPPDAPVPFMQVPQEAAPPFKEAGPAGSSAASKLPSERPLADKLAPNKTAPEKRAAPAKITLPPLDLLLPAKTDDARTSRENLEEKGQKLMACLGDFDVQGELVRITPGPVVTMFEIRPAPGIRVNRIANLSDDLGRALSAMSVRIQAPIPGSDTVGIEIPNGHRQVVNFLEIAKSAEFAKGCGPLTMILGKDIAGKPYLADLSRMPHLLVAGATGAGKSVCLNCILISLLYRLRPADMRLLLVDPKRIEMALYADSPHLVHPVVTEMADAKNALDWAVHEMDRRYQAIARLGVRDVAAYNQKMASFHGNIPAIFEDLEPLPYLVIVIDELADLMMTASREVESSIVRLAQLARAAGIHMILATQRPSVDVVTGLIKANFPCRISFQVTSKHDSRTILDQVGAEHLLGRGDMLFKPSGGRPLRLHGPFLSDGECAAVVEHWKNQLEPDYQIDFTKWSGETNAQASGGADATTDPLYEDARNFVLGHGQASISLLQRQFKIGFNRSARIMAQFEKEGLIGPADGSKPRQVLR